jgi:condensin complex subunit 2
MGKLIKEDSGARGVNFQKASCTLDASVKIYSHRVDDTYASSHRILESLSRNGAGDGEDGTGERAAARVGTKAASNRLNIAETIERNAENLNATTESEHATDPMFHKMSKAFDEGGARGMLMNNLRVTPGSCALVFASDGLTEGSATASTESAMVDVTDLVFKCGFAASDLTSMTLCPIFSDYRQTIGVPEDVTGALDASTFASASVWTSASFPSSSSHSSGGKSSSLVGAGSSPVEEFCPAAGDDEGMGMGGGGDFDDYAGAAYDDGNDNDDADDCDEEGNYIASTRRASMAVGGPAAATSAASAAVIGADDDDTAPLQTHKIRWEDDGNGPPSASEWVGIGVAGAPVSQASEYAFFDLDALMKNNTWAGARHWRYASRRREATTKPAAEAEEGAEDGKEAPAAKATKGRAKKAAFALVFDGTAVPESSFAVSTKSRGDATLMTNAAVEKELAKAEEGELFLPSDAHIETKDLCRLFLCPKVLVPPSMLAHMLTPKPNAAPTGDLIWGQIKAAPAPLGPVGCGYNDYDDADDDFDDEGGFPAGGAEDYDYNAPSSSGSSETASEEVLEGLALNSNKLLQAARVVEKVDIGYAMVAKKVNVRKLKGDLWGLIASGVGVESDVGGEENMAGYSFAAKAGKGQKGDDAHATLSFQEVVNEIAAGQRQQDVTLPFYFICLLHLANEKVG